jgi:hypothetical protein
MMQATTAGVRPDTAEAARFSASAPSTFRLERPAARDLSLPKAPKRAILAQTHREYGECRLIFILSSTAKQAEPKCLKGPCLSPRCQANCFVLRH